MNFCIWNDANLTIPLATDATGLARALRSKARGLPCVSYSSRFLFEEELLCIALRDDCGWTRP